MPKKELESDDTLEDGLTPEAVSTRAGGRPPEEELSEDPELQAQVILEDSEERTTERGEESTEK